MDAGLGGRVVDAASGGVSWMQPRGACRGCGLRGVSWMRPWRACLKAGLGGRVVERPRGACSRAASGACSSAASGACRGGPGACLWAGLASKAGSVSGPVWAWSQDRGVTSGRRVELGWAGQGSA